MWLSTAVNIFVAHIPDICASLLFLRPWPEAASLEHLGESSSDYVFEVMMMRRARWSWVLLGNANISTAEWMLHPWKKTTVNFTVQTAGEGLNSSLPFKGFQPGMVEALMVECQKREFEQRVANRPGRAPTCGCAHGCYYHELSSS